MLFFDKNINVIFIMLGFSCNFRCKYCLQHENKHIEIYNKQYNKDIIKFILNQADRNEYGLAVQFFGGEPLLYLDTIKSIVNELKHHKNIHFTTITNGSLITEDIANYLVENDINVSISWDGRTTKQSRIIDVFETNKENIFKLKNGFALSGVMNHYNSPKMFLEDVLKIKEEFKQYHNYEDDKINFNIDNLHNFTKSDEEIYKLNYEQYSKEMKEIFHNFLFDNEKNSSVENDYASTFIYRLKEYREEHSESYSRCGGGIDVLNLDLDGNLYLCHNETTKKLGSIYDNMESYMNNHKRVLDIPSRYKNHCSNCNVRFLCEYGCAINKVEDENCEFCTQQKAYYTPIIDTVLSVL